MSVHFPQIRLPEEEVEFFAIRAQGAGGQNVNKVSNAIHLRFDIAASSLPEEIKKRLMLLRDQRVSADGVVVIKAQSHRSLARNRIDALTRLRELIARAAQVPVVGGAARPPPPRPPHGSQKKRIDNKLRRGMVKVLRGRVGTE